MTFIIGLVGAWFKIIGFPVKCPHMATLHSNVRTAHGDILNKTAILHTSVSNWIYKIKRYYIMFW